MSIPEKWRNPVMVDRTCKWCHSPFKARKVDVKRGWALFCSKRCKALEQEKRTHQYAGLQAETRFDSDWDEGPGWDAHKGLL